MTIDLSAARVRRVLLDDGWHAVEDTDSGSSFQVDRLRVTSGDDAGLGFSFVDHHTRKRLAGPLAAIRGLELDD